jgi:hypothetical protein
MEVAAEQISSPIYQPGSRINRARDLQRLNLGRAPRSVSEYLKYAHSNRKMLCFRQERTTQYGSENEFSDTLLACLIHEG